MTEFLRCPEPYIRYVNNYRPDYSYVEQERILFDFELMYVMHGEVEMHYGTETFTLRKGDVFYLEPFVSNYIVVEEKNAFHTHCIHFDWRAPAPEDDFLAEEFYLHAVFSEDHHRRAARLKTRPVYLPESLQLPNHITGAPYEKMSSLFSRCYYAFCEKHTVSRCRLQSCFWEILAELTACTAFPNREPVHPQILAAMEYLRANYYSNRSVSALAAQFHLSPKYFGTLFKQAAGKSVAEFVLELRLYAAREMLLGTSMSIEEIAAKTGFQNAFYFSRCFKQKESLSPSAYRKRMRGAD